MTVEAVEYSEHMANVQEAILRIFVSLSGWMLASCWVRKVTDVVRSLRLCVVVMLVGVGFPKSPRKH